MLRRGYIKSNIDIFQMGYNSGGVKASAGTHDRGGCIDVGQYFARHIMVWRDWGWTVQRRDLRGVVTHGHGWPYGCTHLAPAAQSQERDWDRRDAGLVGTATVQGPWPVKKWDTAYKENVVSLLGDIKKEIADEVAGELASNTKFLNAVADAVLDRDGKIENTFTGNPLNKFVAIKTALGTLGERSKPRP